MLAFFLSVENEDKNGIVKDLDKTLAMQLQPKLFYESIEEKRKAMNVC